MSNGFREGCQWILFMDIPRLHQLCATDTSVDPPSTSACYSRYCSCRRTQYAVMVFWLSSNQIPLLLRHIIWTRWGPTIYNWRAGRMLPYSQISWRTWSFPSIQCSLLNKNNSTAGPRGSGERGSHIVWDVAVPTTGKCLEPSVKWDLFIYN